MGFMNREDSFRGRIQKTAKTLLRNVEKTKNGGSSVKVRPVKSKLFQSLVLLRAIIKMIFHGNIRKYILFT